MNIIRTSGRKGATKELAQEQVKLSVELIGQAKDAESSVTMLYAALGTTPDELTTEAEAVSEVVAELDKLRFDALAATFAHPLEMEVASRKAALDALGNMLRTRAASIRAAGGDLTPPRTSAATTTRITDTGTSTTVSTAASVTASSTAAASLGVPTSVAVACPGTYWSSLAPVPSVTPWPPSSYAGTPIHVNPPYVLPPAPSSAPSGTLYAPPNDDLSDAYYATFPPPWNVKPRSTRGSVSDFLKIATQALPKLTGSRKAYLMWRETYLPCVHMTPLDLNIKVMLLRSSIKPEDDTMKEFLDALVCSAEGYRSAIAALESAYGGEASLLLVRQDALLSLPALKEGDHKGLEVMYTRMGAFLAQWAATSGCSTQSVESITFFSSLLRRVDRKYALKYVTWQQDTAKPYGLQSFHEWLGKQLGPHRVVAQLASNDVQKSSDDHKPSNSGWQKNKKAPTPLFPQTADRTFPSRDRFFLAKETGEGKPNTCPLCNGAHPLGRCGKMRAAAPRERREFLISQRRCFLCFSDGHMVGSCTVTYRCKKCGGKHHTMLHQDRNVEGQAALVARDAPEEPDPHGAEEAMEYGLLTQAERDTRVSLRTLPVWVQNPVNGRGFLVNALLDDGCTAGALVSRELASKLLFKGIRQTKLTEGVGGHITEYSTVVAPLQIARPDKEICRTVLAQVLHKPAGSYCPVDWRSLKENFPHLRPLPLPALVSGGGVDILIGNQCPFLQTALDEVSGFEGQPIARKTPLGWTVVGPTTAVTDPSKGKQLVLFTKAVNSPVHISTVEAEAMELGRAGAAASPLAKVTTPADKSWLKIIQRMLDVEDPGETEVLSPKEEFVIKQLRRSIQKSGNQYQAACTWAPGKARPPLNYQQAYTRLTSLEASKYFKDLNLKKHYAAVFDSWEKDAFIRQVPYPSPEVAYLLPHFPILKDSPTTPVRPVMDCKVGLNGFLLSGPNLLNDMVAVLLRFRSGLYAYSGDIKQMFLRILLAPEDRPFHCFLWRSDRALEPTVYQFQVHVFGNKGSPCVAVFVVKEHAAKFKETFPEAAETLTHSTLIDDILDSVDTQQEAVTQLANIQHILAQADMKLAKCHSNSPLALASLAPDMIASEVLDVAAACTKDVDMPRLKALGIQYNHKTDMFSFAVEVPQVAHWTLRWVLKTFPRLFDPLGLLIPFTIRARIYFSTLVQQGATWDGRIQVSTEWQDWLAELVDLPHVLFPRALKVSPNLQGSLHIFSDASEKAYAAVAYLLTPALGEGLPHSALVAAKAHVAPRKKCSIPRLELMAAVLGTKLRRMVLTALKVPVIRVFHWTDSTTVLYWVNDDTQRFQKFVANRLDKLRDRTTLEEWRYVPTSLNPADAPSRGVPLMELQGDSLWQKGPDYLLKSCDYWPVSPALIKTSDVLLEMKKEEQIFVLKENTALEPVLDFTRYSSWRQVCKVLVVIMKWRFSGCGDEGENVWARAEAAALRQAQLPLEALRGECSKATIKEMGFTQMRPEVATDGLLRGAGRLSQVEELALDARKPILLPRDTAATKLVIRNAHERLALHYGGVNYTLGRLMSRFWIPRAREAVKKTLRQCVPCQKRKLTVRRPPQGKLPHFRTLPPLGEPLAFATTAVDCAGPYKVKILRKYCNNYMLLLTCCQTRAVRLERLTDLSIDAFLMALTRAASRGVNPHTVVSDNGGNFEGTDSLLGQLWKEAPRDALTGRRPEIKWKFNPPYAPHYGGVFERLIRAAKEALHHALPSHLSLTEEQLQTAMAAVEAVLNARPLAYVSADGDDISPLTPNHFLYGSASQPLFDDLFSHYTLASLATKWHVVQKATAVFLKTFHREIRPFMQQTRMYKGEAKMDLAVGDVVMFFLPTHARKWPLARIVKTFPGSDGRVRTVQVALRGVDDTTEEYRALPPKFFIRDVGEVALILPAETIQS